MNNGAVDSCACRKLEPYVVDIDECHQRWCVRKSSEGLTRIHIIGSPGSGKTTLAHELGNRLGIEVHELDRLAFTGPDYAERPLSERLDSVHRIAEQPAWITEGYFLGWTGELLARSNMIVWLDHITWARGAWRITQRYIRSAVGEAWKRQGRDKFARFPDYARHLKQYLQVLSSSRAYYYLDQPPTFIERNESRSSTAAFLASYQAKVIHCRNDKAVQALRSYMRISRQLEL